MWSKMDVMKAVSSTRCALSGNCRMNSGPDGISSGGLKTLTPPLVRCCQRETVAGSLMVWRTTLTSASPIVTHCFMIHFLKFRMVVPNASFLSSCISLERWSKMLFILSTYCCTSSGFCAPASGHSSSSSSIKSITGGASSEAISNHDVLDTKPKEGGNLVCTSKTRFRMVFLVETAAYIGSKTQSA